MFPFSQTLSVNIHRGCSHCSGPTPTEGLGWEVDSILSVRVWNYSKPSCNQAPIVAILPSPSIRRLLTNSEQNIQLDLCSDGCTKTNQWPVLYEVRWNQFCNIFPAVIIKDIDYSVILM